METGSACGALGREMRKPVKALLIERVSKNIEAS